jgi:ABC-2 type transport system ATP-binding protein
MTAIKVRHLRKNFGSFEALKGISFDVMKGEVFGFLGPNGAGKTTAMKILTGYIMANSGEAVVAGFDCFADSFGVRRRIGYLPENNPLYTDMKVFEYLKFIAELNDIEPALISMRIKKVMEDCGLTEYVARNIGSLSKGYRQRVGLAATLVHDPEILILDEPTVGLDPNQIVEIRTLIKKLGKEKTVILCSHLLSEVELTCNRMLIIDRGQVVASGTPIELRGIVEDHANLNITVRGDKEKARLIVSNISGVKEVRHHAVTEKGAHGFYVFTTRNRDPRPAIAQAIVENEMQLIEIHREFASLEDVFSKVTQH